MKFFQIVISVSVGLAAGCIPVVGYTSAGAAMTGPGAVHPPAGGGGRGRGGQRERILLHAVCGEVLPGLPVHDGAGHGEQGNVHLFPVPWQGLRLHRHLHGAGGSSAWASPCSCPCGLGWTGVLYSMPVSDLLTFVICVIVIGYTYRTLDFDGAKDLKLCEN